MKYIRASTIRDLDATINPDPVKHTVLSLNGKKSKGPKYAVRATLGLYRLDRHGLARIGYGEALFGWFVILTGFNHE